MNIKPSSAYLLSALLRKRGICHDELRMAAICSRHPLPHSIRALSDTLDELHVPNPDCCREVPAHAEFRPQAVSILRVFASCCRAVDIEGTPIILVDNRRLPEMMI